MIASKEATDFMRKNRYRNCGDRSCANCANMYFIKGKMKCTGGPTPESHFNVYQFMVCDAWAKKRTGEVQDGLPC